MLKVEMSRQNVPLRARNFKSVAHAQQPVTTQISFVHSSVSQAVDVPPGSSLMKRTIDV